MFRAESLHLTTQAILAIDKRIEAAGAGIMRAVDGLDRQVSAVTSKLCAVETVHTLEAEISNDCVRWIQLSKVARRHTGGPCVADTQQPPPSKSKEATSAIPVTFA